MRRLRFENLETRDLMAGNISVSRGETGDLIITGDSAANVFTLVQTGATMYQVTGNMQTTINGNSTQQVANITGNISITTGAGDDQVLMGSMTTTTPTRVRGELLIKTGTGADRVSLFNVVGTTATIQMGSNSENEIDRANIRSSAFVNLSLETGGGNDVIEVVNSKFTQGLTLETGDGNDLLTMTNLNLRNISVELGTGDDRGLFTGKFKSSGGISLDGGNDDDIIDARSSSSTDLDLNSSSFLNFEVRRQRPG